MKRRGFLGTIFGIAAGSLLPAAAESSQAIEKIVPAGDPFKVRFPDGEEIICSGQVMYREMIETTSWDDGTTSWIPGVKKNG